MSFARREEDEAILSGEARVARVISEKWVERVEAGDRKAASNPQSTHSHAPDNDSLSSLSA